MAAPARPFVIEATATITTGSIGAGLLHRGQTLVIREVDYRRTLDDYGDSWLDELDEDQQVRRWGEIKVRIISDDV
jgi:hypothetical protein